MVLLGVRVNELPEPARSDGHAEKTEFMAEGAEAADHSCERESHMGGQSATANTLKELYLVGYDHRICQKRFRNRLGRRLRVLPRHVPHCSAKVLLALRQVLCHVLLIFLRRGHTNTISNMQYSAVIRSPAAPSPCPLFLAPPPLQAPAPAHRPLRHILLQLQSCKMNNLR
jgi:hypothetical protein